MAAHPQERYVVDPKGKKTAIILSLKRYRELMEDLHDPAVVAERRKERSVSLEQMKRRLKKDGLL
jgi:PHD/YefM family antitoxin component YafN of YafNO toxin-antitoxin module